MTIEPRVPAEDVARASEAPRRFRLAGALALAAGVLAGPAQAQDPIYKAQLLEDLMKREPAVFMNVASNLGKEDPIRLMDGSTAPRADVQNLLVAALRDPKGYVNPMLGVEDLTGRPAPIEYNLPQVRVVQLASEVATVANCGPKPAAIPFQRSVSTAQSLRFDMVGSVVPLQGVFPFARAGAGRLDKTAFVPLQVSNAGHSATWTDPGAPDVRYVLPALPPGTKVDVQLVVAQATYDAAFFSAPLVYRPDQSFVFSWVVGLGNRGYSGRQYQTRLGDFFDAEQRRTGVIRGTVSGTTLANARLLVGRPQPVDPAAQCQPDRGGRWALGPANPLMSGAAQTIPIAIAR